MANEYFATENWVKEYVAAHAGSGGTIDDEPWDIEFPYVIYDDLMSCNFQGSPSYNNSSKTISADCRTTSTSSLSSKSTTFSIGPYQLYKVVQKGGKLLTVKYTLGAQSILKSISGNPTQGSVSSSNLCNTATATVSICTNASSTTYVLTQSATTDGNSQTKSGTMTFSLADLKNQNYYIVVTVSGTAISGLGNPSWSGSNWTTTPLYGSGGSISLATWEVTN